LSSGVLGWLVQTNSHLEVNQFRVRGTTRPARIFYGYADALLGAGDNPADWAEQQSASFRFGRGDLSKRADARVKWNVIGNRFSLWAPRGPNFSSVEVRVDGKVAAVLDFHSDRDEPSKPVWQSRALQDACHAVVLTGATGGFPVDCLEVSSGH